VPLIRKNPPVAKVEVPARDGKTELIYVDKNGHETEKPKWLNESKRNPYANRKSFVVPELPWKNKNKGEQNAKIGNGKGI